MRDYVTDAFNMASDNGRYAITARVSYFVPSTIKSYAPTIVVCNGIIDVAFNICFFSICISFINMASDNGRYAITARQIWYKMREISGVEEKKHTYADFTQEILTEWIDDNPEYEDKVNFSDRVFFQYTALCHIYKSSQNRDLYGYCC